MLGTPEICECKYANPSRPTVSGFRGVPVRETMAWIPRCFTAFSSPSVTGRAHPATFDFSSQLKFPGKFASTDNVGHLIFPNQRLPRRVRTCIFTEFDCFGRCVHHLIECVCSPIHSPSKSTLFRQSQTSAEACQFSPVAQH